MANLLVTAGYSGIKYKSQQLKQTSHKTASRKLLNDEILHVTKNQRDQLCSSNYQNISKVIFNSEQWHGVMMDSPKIEEIIECHISSEILENIDTKKRNHAKNTNQIESTYETSIEKKANKIHREIQDVVINVNEQLYDIKNQSLINNEMARRNNKNAWHKICKELVLYKGVWRNNVFDKDPSKVPTTCSSTTVNGISRPLLEPRTRQGYWYFDKKVSQEYMGSNPIDFLGNDAFDTDNTVSTLNIQTNQGSQNIKIFSKALSEREIESLGTDFISH